MRYALVVGPELPYYRAVGTRGFLWRGPRSEHAVLPHVHVPGWPPPPTRRRIFGQPTTDRKVVMTHASVLPVDPPLRQLGSGRGTPVAAKKGRRLPEPGQAMRRASATAARAGGEHCALPVHMCLGQRCDRAGRERCVQPLHVCPAQRRVCVRSRPPNRLRGLLRPRPVELQGTVPPARR